jgi:hypothetical protein
MGIEPTWSAWDSCQSKYSQQLAIVKTVSYQAPLVAYNCYLLCFIAPKWTISNES